MPGHSFEDRQRKAGYDSFSRAAQDTTPAPISNREFNEQLEQAQREREQARGVSLTGDDSRKNTQAQIQNIRETFEDPKKVFQDAREIRNIADPPFGVLQAPIDDLTNKIGNFRDAFTGIFSGGMPNFQFPSLLTALKNVKPTVDSFKDPNFLATIENKFRTDPNFKKGDFYKEYKDLIDEAFESEETAMGRMTGEDIFNAQTERAFNQAQAGELGSDLQIRTNPTGYYTDEEGKVTNTPQTSGQALTMAENLTFADIENSNLGTAEKRRLGAALMEARALAMDRQTTTDATGQMVSKLPPGTPIQIPLPGPRPGPIPGPGLPEPIPTPTPTPFPGTGIISAVTDPRFVGPSFPGVLPTGQNYFNQGIADPRFQRFFQIANQFPTTT